MSRPRVLVALAGAVLLGSLWLDWYGFEPASPFGSDPVGIVQGMITIGVGPWSPTAWGMFAVLDVVLAAIALVAVAAVVRPPAARAVRVLGLVAAALVVFRLAVPPEDGLSIAAGGLVALVASVVATVAAWRSA